MHLDLPSLPHIHHRVDLIEDFFHFLEFIALHLTTFYGPQAAQVNEESHRESSLHLTLTQYAHDENLDS
jgi:hypothetical protein